MASVSMMANAATAGITSNITSISEKVTGGSQEKSAKETKEENSQQEEFDYFDPANFCYMCPLYFLTCSAFLGIIFFIVFAASSPPGSISILISLLLLGAGLFAAFEYWMLGALKDQIEFLKRLRVAMQKDTTRLQGEVGSLKGETEELEQNVKDLNDAGEDLKKAIDDFDTLTENLRNTHSELESANADLKDSVTGLSEQRNKLQETVIAMTTQYDLLQGEMEKFSELRDSLSAMSSDAGDNMSEMIQQTMSKFDAMDHLLHDNEVVLLQQLAADVEFLDDSEGMSQKEWKRFESRLPKRYRKIVKDKKLDFKKLDTDRDGSIDPKELASLIGDLVKEASKNEESEI